MNFHIRQVILYYAPDAPSDLRIWMAIVTVPLVFLSLIRDLKYLAPVSLISNILLGVSLVVIFYYLLQDVPDVSSRPLAAPLDQLPLFFGTAVFAFEGISLVLPLQRKMRTPRDLHGWNGVLNTGIIIVAILFFAVGFYGYLKYGDDTAPSITLNLDEKDM